MMNLEGELLFLYYDNFVIETYGYIFNQVIFFPKIQGTCDYAIK